MTFLSKKEKNRLQMANANDINTMPAADGPGNYLFIYGLCHFQLAQDLRPAEIK